MFIQNKKGQKYTSQGFMRDERMFGSTVGLSSEGPTSSYDTKSNRLAFKRRRSSNQK